jgi:superfamily II DNA or RNA helicase
MELRNYQFNRMVQPVRRAFSEGAKRPLLTAPTGAGKTATFSYMMRHAVQRGNPSWVMVHRDLLVRQASRSLTAWGCPHGIIAACGGFDGQAAQVVSIQTLSSRLKKGWVPPIRPKFLISDECHHACSASWLSVFDYFKDVPTLGVTATPCRLDGKGLGAVFDRLILGPTPVELMDLGFLVRPKYFGVPPSQLPDLEGIGTIAGDFNKEQLAKVIDDKPSLTGDVVEHYKRRAMGLKFVGFACNLKHANKLRDAFIAAGLPCDVIHGELSDEERGVMIGRLERGEILGLWSVDLISEGFDLPEVSCVILCRPTKSLTVHIQQIGRGARKFEGKSFFIVLDHAGNLTRLGPWEMEQEWSLEGVSKTKRDKELLTQITQCPSCFAVYAKAPCCPHCGSEAAAQKERELKRKEGELKEMEAKEIERIAREKMEAKKAQSGAKTMSDLIAVGKKRGMKNPHGWAVNVFLARTKNQKQNEKKTTKAT